MNGILVVARREFFSYFSSALAVVFIGVFVAANGAATFFVSDFFGRGQADLTAFFSYHPWLLAVLMPAIGMRLWAEERRAGTLELLLTLPVTVWQLVLGKFLAGWAFAALALAMTIPIWITVNYLGEPDNGVILASYIGSLLMAGAYLALSCCISALTGNVVTAFVLSVAASILMLMFTQESLLTLLPTWAAGFATDFASGISFSRHFDAITRGVLEFGDVLFFVSFIALLLFLNCQVLEARSMNKPAMNTGIAGRLVVVVSAIVIFLSINLIASLKLEGAQVDLTEQKLFTLADGAKAILADVREPIKVTLYRSRDLINAVPDLQPHATQVAGLLRSFEQQSGGKISVDVVDVQPFSPEEDQALAYKLAGFNLNRAGDKGYFGLVGTNTVDTLETIPFLDPSRQAFLQYDLARFVHRLANPKEPKVAVVDGMSMLGVRDAGRMPWAVVEMLSQDYAVTPLPPTMTSVPPDTDVLIVAHPATLTPQAEYAIDQFVLGGGPALVFVDPFAERSAPSQQNAMIPMYPSSDIAPLMTAWGVAMDPTKVVGDSDMALQTVGTAGRQQVVANYLPWLKIDGDAFNQDDPVTARLNVMRMSSAGALHPVDGATTTMVPLIQTTPNSMLLDQALVMQRPNPNYLLGQFVPSGVRQVLAAEVTGPAHTAFPDGKPADPEGGDKGSETAPQLTSGNVNLIVVADADMLADDHVVNRNGQPVSSNGDFVLNAVEKLAGGDALIALRGGGQVSRPFTRLQAMQASADETYRAKEQDLTKELADIQQRLLELQAPVQSGGEDLQAMYERQQAEITTANTRMMEVRRELRDIRAALRSDVDRMDTWLKVLNIGLVPILLILAALGVALWQRARRSSANAQPVGE